MCTFSGPDKLVSALAPKIEKKKKKIFFFFRFFPDLVSARPAYIANEIRGPQSARSNGTDLYLSYYIYTSSKLMTFWVKQTTQWENKRNAFVSFIMRVRTLSDLQ